MSGTGSALRRDQMFCSSKAQARFQVRSRQLPPRTSPRRPLPPAPELPGDLRGEAGGIAFLPRGSPATTQSQV